MARRPRSVIGGEIHHVLNRGNCRLRIFHKDADYLAFLRLLEEGRARTGMRILAYCLLPNHWHLVLWPRHAKDLAAFVGWVSNTAALCVRCQEANNLPALTSFPEDGTAGTPGRH